MEYGYGYLMLVWGGMGWSWCGTFLHSSLGHRSATYVYLKFVAFCTAVWDRDAAVSSCSVECCLIRECIPRGHSGVRGFVRAAFEWTKWCFGQRLGGSCFGHFKTLREFERILGSFIILRSLKYVYGRWAEVYTIQRKTAVFRWIVYTIAQRP